jgi:1-aminocyclopropane-1-carboxylate deaminase
VQHPPIQKLNQTGGEIYLLRLDLPDPLSGGNKFYKLKRNLEEIRRQKKTSLLTFGGAFSNHIAAVAAAGRRAGIPTTGIIRGEELNKDSNKVLRFAAECGMQLHFISREDYRKRNDPEFVRSLAMLSDDAYILPEGGSNAFAVKGCMEILPPESAAFDIIICPVGTGATLAGIIASAAAHQLVTGIAVLEGKSYLETEVKNLLTGFSASASWQINHDFNFGGYAKTDTRLEEFIAEMKNTLPLDNIYSGKALFAAKEIAKEAHGKKILFIHTGGYAFEEDLH